ncbi:unnamed protein product [Lasius platythorax]|uniref:Uncharacterized protein n=1 Tax=Lasius platythorax TaxID=488582 RepID=A0AAV2NKN1_9HYME
MWGEGPFGQRLHCPTKVPGVCRLGTTSRSQGGQQGLYNGEKKGKSPSSPTKAQSKSAEKAAAKPPVDPDPSRVATPAHSIKSMEVESSKEKRNSLEKRKTRKGQGEETPALKRVRVVSPEQRSAPPDRRSEKKDGKGALGHDTFGHRSFGHGQLDTVNWTPFL